MGIMVLFPPVSQDKVGYRAYNHSYYQITENSLHCLFLPLFGGMSGDILYANVMLLKRTCIYHSSGIRFDFCFLILYNPFKDE